MLYANQDKKGVWYISRPDGSPLLEWQSNNEYKKWAENGNLEEKASGGFGYELKDYIGVTTNLLTNIDR